MTKEVWQFYVEYSLREDTARYANETRGFDSLLNAHDLALSKVDRLTAWAMTTVSILHQFPALLAIVSKSLWAICYKDFRRPSHAGKNAALAGSGLREVNL